MILFRSLIFLCISSTYASSNVFSHPACRLDPAFRILNAQNVRTQDVLKAASLPGLCSRSEEDRYEKPDKSIKLAYVTPWNGRGYDLAKWFASTLTHVSPVWYQLVMEGNAKPELRGGHDVDESWLQELRSAYRPPKIVPRFQLQLSQKAAETILYYPQGEVEQIADALVAEVQKHEYDGVTLELPAPHIFTALIGRIGDALHDIEKELVLVIPPLHTAEQSGRVFSADHVADLENEVDYFAVMTYDHAGSMGVEGPNAPLPWMRMVLEDLVVEDDSDFAELGESSDSEKGRAGKILMGLPFYGYRFSKGQTPEAYTAADYLGFLKRNQAPPPRIAWDEDSKEHRVVVGHSSLWYPSLLSLLYRLQLAEETGVGIAIWELGQGLDQFIDIL